MRAISVSLCLVVYFAYPALAGVQFGIGAGQAYSSPFGSIYPSPLPEIYSPGGHGLLSTATPYFGGDFGFAGGYAAAEPAFPPPIISKFISYHSAPEEPPEVRVRHLAIGQPQKTYRVVFIKAPAQTPITRISASVAPKEEKTVIYVLSKKAETELINEIEQPPATEPSKPEVIFVKYKTPEEAVHAQQTIQAQYDALGGSTHLSDEGVAPLTSVVGSLGQTGLPGDYQPTTESLFHAIATRSPKALQRVKLTPRRH